MKWETQKDLTFEFVNFLEEKLFNNPNLQAEATEVLLKLNQYYGKLYLVLDTEIIGNINKLIDKTISSVQRYYFYREIRKQLMQNFRDMKDSDFPYLSLSVAKAPILKGDQKTVSSFGELKNIIHL